MSIFYNVGIFVTYKKVLQFCVKSTKCTSHLLFKTQNIGFLKLLCISIKISGCIVVLKE